MRYLAFTIAMFLAGGAYADTPQKVVFLGITMLNTSMEPLSPEELARHKSAEAQLVQTLEDSGKYVFIDPAPVAEKSNLFANLAQCNGCDTQFAEELGADLALTGEIQKTSNLILGITIYLREAGTGVLVAGGSADIRGNNDESWRRGVSYILRNRILNK